MFDRFILTLWLFVRVIQDQIRGMIHACSQMLNRPFAKLVYAEDKVVLVGHAVDEILKDVNAKGMMQIYVCVEGKKRIR